MDDTSQRIVDAAMGLIRDKGYVATTTKDIAKQAGVNECTLFRKFSGKKDIVLAGIDQEKWRADVTPLAFENVTWDLRSDLEMFMNAYMDRITPDFVNLSIGLRAPQIYEETAPFIMMIPKAFVSSLIRYFEEMEEKGQLSHGNYESWAMTVFSATFGYTFLKASFDDSLSKLSRHDYVRDSVTVFLEGIGRREAPEQ
ncbi:MULTISPECIES: TetR/AcrR family transcriptional regulator [Hungatella]|uniref:TetR/AcrR family transcriptional regulator n=1 Tax=Hungatella TaxID=1649459 RepID=UPI0011DD9993|nr:TetR/AcrR family transcriptional regulator [Hungatella hathewayi]